MWAKRNKDKINAAKGAKSCLYYLMPAVIVLISLLNVTQAAGQKYEPKFSMSKANISNDGRYNAVGMSQYAPSLAVNCNKRSAGCDLQCAVNSFDRAALIAEFEKAYVICGKPMHLTLSGTPFNESFGVADLAGNFELSSLQIFYCNKFSKIEDYAFDKPSLHKLEWLEIHQRLGNRIEVMNEKTFEGLKFLKYLKIYHHDTAKKVTADGFLKPLAATLEDIWIKLPSEKDFIGYDPANWFGDFDYPKLNYVDFSGTYFPGTFNTTAFGKLTNVTRLYLTYCSIESIDDETFLPIIDTLTKLYIPGNELTTLSLPLLQMLADASVVVTMSLNKWDCSCENEHFVTFLRKSDPKLFYQAICYTPKEWTNQYVRDVELCCHEACSAPSLAVNCNKRSVDGCDLWCEVLSFDRAALITEIEKAYVVCGKPMFLTLDGTPFNESFGVADLAGNFELWSLQINYCSKFSKIEEYAFDKPSLHKLERLEILQRSGNRIEVMNEKTFEGLKFLKYLNIYHQDTAKKVTADGFLKPLAASLKDIRIRLPSEKDFIGYDPANWFGDFDYPKLNVVSFSETYFPGIFNTTAFGKLTNVTRLYLTYCSIESIDDETFSPIIDTLTELYIPGNELRTLSLPLLQMLTDKSVYVHMDLNKWDCSCENEYFVTFLKNSDPKLFDKAICSTPKEWANQYVRDVELCCHEACSAPSLAVNCNKRSVDVCDIWCEVLSFDRVALITEIEKVYVICGTPMHLTLSGTPFNESFGVADLAGNFELWSLQINYCSKFSKIEDYAFDKPSLHKLEWLEIYHQADNGIELMNEKTFEGLKHLRYLIINHHGTPKKLTADGFLKPLTKTLEHLKIRLPSEKDFIGYDPANWFGNFDYPKLNKVDFSATYFPGIFNTKAFGKLNNLTNLYLTYCSIESIDDETFSPIIDSLNHLDLIGNKLTTLSLPLLQMLADKSVNVDMYLNKWDCSCENEHFVTFLKGPNQKWFDVGKCATPEKWAKQNVKYVELSCHEGRDKEEGTNSITIATTITTAPSEHKTDDVPETTIVPTITSN